jgi:hypothetical protein
MDLEQLFLIVLCCFNLGFVFIGLLCVMTNLKIYTEIVKEHIIRKRYETQADEMKHASKRM